MKSSPLLPASTWLDEFSRQVERLGAAIEVEAVHRLRVSAGRLSVWLELGARRALRDDLRYLRRAAAAVRDLDVMSARDTGSPWAEELRQERSEQALRLRRALSTPSIGALVEGLALVPEPDPICVRSTLQRLKRGVQRAGDRIEGAEDRDCALHNLRRRLRRLRYALEWTGADASDLRDLQGHLGGLNDLAVELQKLEARAADRSLDRQRNTVLHEMDERRQRALDAWHELRPRIREL